jgi:uncharacterized protein YndB with AHSA1/START domain
MTSSRHKPVDAPRQSVVLERAFAAPRALLFRLFTEPEHLVRWWCPYPLTFPVCEWDPRPGGRLHLEMQFPDGTRYPFIGAFSEVEPPGRLVFSMQSDIDAEGMPQTEVVTTITFTERGDETVVRVEIAVVKAGPPTAESLAGMAFGWMQDFGRLAFYLLRWTKDGMKAGAAPVVTTPSEREIVITRAFAAPREQLFAALTDPAAVASEGDRVLAEPPELLVTSLAPLAAFGQDRVDAVHLSARDETTLLTRISLFPSKAERDGARAAGMIEEAIATYARLAVTLTARR